MSRAVKVIRGNVARCKVARGYVATRYCRRGSVARGNDRAVMSCYDLFVCTAIDSTPRSATVLRPVSLEPVWPEGVQREKIFPEKWPVAELPKKKVLPLMLFYGKNLF